MYYLYARFITSDFHLINSKSLFFMANRKLSMHYQSIHKLENLHAEYYSLLMHNSIREHEKYNC